MKDATFTDADRKAGVNMLQRAEAYVLEKELAFEEINFVDVLADFATIVEKEAFRAGMLRAVDLLVDVYQDASSRRAARLAHLIRTEADAPRAAGLADTEDTIVERDVFRNGARIRRLDPKGGFGR